MEPISHKNPKGRLQQKHWWFLPQISWKGRRVQHFAKCLIYWWGKFWFDPITDKQNNQYWCNNKPSPIAFKFLFPAKHMVRIGFTKSFIIIGAYFWNKCDRWSTLWRDRMLCSAAADTMPKRRIVDQVFFQKDGVNTARATLDLLKNSFQAEFISRENEFFWPAYSPDLSPVDFGFSEYLKLKIYCRNFSSFETLWPAVDKIPLHLYSSSVDYFLFEMIWELGMNRKYTVYTYIHNEAGFLQSRIIKLPKLKLSLLLY